MAVPPLAYLMKQLSFRANEWTALPEADRETLKQWAVEEMKALGL